MLLVMLQMVDIVTVSGFILQNIDKQATPLESTAVNDHISLKNLTEFPHRIPQNQTFKPHYLA